MITNLQKQELFY